MWSRNFTHILYITLKAYAIIDNYIVKEPGSEEGHKRMSFEPSPDKSHFVLPQTIISLTGSISSNGNIQPL